MKHLQTLVFLALLLFLSTACNPRKIVLSGEVDPRLFGDDSSWMYLYTVRINDYYIADSCQILNHRYRLTADLPEEELYRLLIPDAHAQLYLVLRPGDRLRVNLDSISGQSAYLDIPQSYATTALRSVMFTLHGNGQILSTWSDSLAFLPFASPAYDRLSDSISELKAQQGAQFVALLDSARYRESPEACSMIIVQARYTYGLDDSTADSLTEVCRLRFPGHRCFAREFPPQSLQGHLAENRIRALKGLPLLPPPRPEPESEAASSPDEPDSLTQIKPYRLGDRIDIPVAGPDTAGVVRRLSDCTTAYVLIDFWASWCGPCREEIPFLQEAWRRYRDDLTVFAVSLDTDAGAWRKAISEAAATSFVHVRIGSDDPSYRALAARFGIRTIPHNLLLDKDRRVVAVDLRGNALRKWLEKVLQK